MADIRIMDYGWLDGIYTSNLNWSGWILKTGMKSYRTDDTHTHYITYIIV